MATVPGTTGLDMISLFPENTWNHRKNGLRADLVKVPKDMKPGCRRVLCWKNNGLFHAM